MVMGVEVVLLCIFPILSDDPRRESDTVGQFWHCLDKNWSIVVVGLAIPLRKREKLTRVQVCMLFPVARMRCCSQSWLYLWAWYEEHARLLQLE